MTFDAPTNAGKRVTSNITSVVTRDSQTLISLNGRTDVVHFKNEFHG